MNEETLEYALSSFRQGQWYSFSDVSNKCYATLIINKGEPISENEFNTIYSTFIISNAAANTREKRTSLLSATDWTASTDVTMSAEMTTYRQALRDITQHANFPNLQDTDWPVAP